MENLDKEKARERILNASIKLFSEKGYDGTRVNEISEAAQVNKALIYYYFKSKEAILENLLETLFTDLSNLAASFIREHIIKMIKDGSLDIEEDRFHFNDEQSLDFFLQNVHIYYKQVID